MKTLTEKVLDSLSTMTAIADDSGKSKDEVKEAYCIIQEAQASTLDAQKVWNEVEQVRQSLLTLRNEDTFYLRSGITDAILALNNIQNKNGLK